MKKAIIIVLLSILVITGCEKVEQGNYKEGTYFATAQDTYGGESNTATATIYVDQNGKIQSVFLDTTYTKDGKLTTKKSLGDNYEMVKYSTATLEWDDQVANLEKKIVEQQGLEWLRLDSDGKTDSVSGVTIKIDALYQAISSAINQAKK